MYVTILRTVLLSNPDVNFIKNCRAIGLVKDLLLYLHVMLVLLTSSQVIDAQGYTPKYQWCFEKLSRFLNKSVVLEPVYFLLISAIWKELYWMWPSGFEIPVVDFTKSTLLDSQPNGCYDF